MPETILDTSVWVTADPVLLVVLVSISGAALLLAVIWPWVFPDKMAQRIQSIMAEKTERRERSLSQSVARHNKWLERWVEDFGRRIDWKPDNLRTTLRQAGYKRRDAFVFYVLAMLLVPLVLFPLAWLYLKFILGAGPIPLLLAAMVSLAGLWLPALFVKNQIIRRMQRISRAWPNVLDLLHLCVNAGMGVESALSKVAREMRDIAPDVADELTLTVSELMYLQNRRSALERLASRVDLAAVRELVAALIQSERYGVSLGETLQTLAEESRRLRLSAAEKKAAALPPKLTVPMILFFLPALFVVILTPALIRVFGLP